MVQRDMRIILALILITLFGSVIAQTKEQIIDNYIKAFNARDIEGYLKPLDDSIKVIKFPNRVFDNGKNKIRASYTSAFRALSGQIEVLGKSEIGDFFVIEQRLKRSEFQSIDQYVIFKFRENRIIETHYLPKNFSWP